jgi:Cu2+-exporting ATPase
LGQASLNESMLTGEQLPLLKQAGDPVYAGTINTDAPWRSGSAIH